MKIPTNILEKSGRMIVMPDYVSNGHWAIKSKKLWGPKMSMQDIEAHLRTTLNGMYLYEWRQDSSDPGRDWRDCTLEVRDDNSSMEHIVDKKYDIGLCRTWFFKNVGCESTYTPPTEIFRSVDDKCLVEIDLAYSSWLQELFGCYDMAASGVPDTDGYLNEAVRWTEGVYIMPCRNQSPTPGAVRQAMLQPASHVFDQHVRHWDFDEKRWQRPVGEASESRIGHITGVRPRVVCQNDEDGDI